MARTPESMAGGARVLRFVLLGGVAVGSIVWFMSGGKEEAKAYGVVPRMTGVEQTAGYQPEPEKPTVPQRTNTAPAADPKDERRRSVPRSGGGGKKDDFMERGLKAGIGGYKADEKVIEAAWTKKEKKSDFRKSGSDCWLPPGAFVPVRSVTRVVTEKAGIVKAKVTADVWDTSGTCLVLPAGTDLVADYAATTTKGEKRVPLSNLELVRPYPADDVVTVNGVAGDPTGAAGIPGETSSNLLSTALLVTASVGIDLATAALTNGGSLIGPIIGANAGRPLDQIARDLWQRPSVNSVDERTDLLLILRQGIAGDDYRDH